MKKNLLLSICLLFISTVNVLAAPPAAFTAGNLVVLRYGDGAAAVATDKQVATFLDEITPSGTLVQSIALPTTTVGNQRALTGKNVFTAEGTNKRNSEGVLVRSEDGAYLSLIGYEAAPLSASSLITTTVIGRVSASGDINTATAVPTNVVTPYYAVSKDGGQFWIGGIKGTGSGVTYIPFEYNKGFTTELGSGTAIGGASETLSLYIYGNRLAYSNAGSIRELIDDSPVTASGVLNNYPGFGAGTDPSSSQFVFLDSDGDGKNDVIYLMNDRVTAGGKIMKITYEYDSNNAMVLKAKESITPPVSTDNMRFLTVKITAGIATIYCTSPSGLYRLTNSVTQPLTGNDFVLLKSAPANTTFRGVAFAPVATTNPVKLTSFTGKALPEGVRLSWVTSSERNNARFEVLRSFDNNNFSVIGTVNGNNNSDRIINYSFVDTHPLAGTNYYQLNQIDYDAKSEKSAIIPVNYNSNSTVLSAHFTSKNQLEISISADKMKNADLYLRDISGKVIVSEKIVLKTGLNSKTLNVKGVLPGVYVLNLVSEKERVSIKLLK